MAAALDGILVIDLSRVLAGPLVGQTLGDLGADVIKVESPAGDDTRRWLPPADAQGRASYHHAANRNKRSIVLDLKDATTSSWHASGARADVVVSNFKPGTLERFGLDYAAVSRGNPASSTARSAASASERAATCPATTHSCRRSAG